MASKEYPAWLARNNQQGVTGRASKEELAWSVSTPIGSWLATQQYR